ncbi:MAG TPA: CoA pyrophosphatase [Dehalococcoidia bacterium]|nr:CoA pyrophosphatase [Dehalococcoidia bacterium]
MSDGARADLLRRLRDAVSIDVAMPPRPHGMRGASVLLLFDPSEATLPLLFVQRSAELRFHAGQIAFPGGGAEPDDRDVVATALREAAEEVGVQPENVEVLGLLQPLITVTSDRWLTPVVALQRGPWDVRGDGVEVAEWFCIPLTDLMTAAHTVRRLERDGRSRDVHFYETHGRVIWGVTGAILHELLHRLGRSD